MNFTHFSTAFPNYLTCSFKPQKPRTLTIKPFVVTAEIPATDRVIPFGMHKGSMLGTIPPKYLKWMSNNLGRSGDSSDWGTLADQVLKDPIYRDRIEWELYEADDEMTYADLEKNFGWDFEGQGWRKVNFHLLGTTKSARVPRKESPSSSSGNAAAGVLKEGQGKLRVSKTIRADEVLSESEKRRRERRERARLKKEQDGMRKHKLQMLLKGRENLVEEDVAVVVDDDDDDDDRSYGERQVGMRKEKLQMPVKGRGNFVNDDRSNGDGGVAAFQKQGHEEENQTVKANRLFPGRESLLRRAMNRRRK